MALRHDQVIEHTDVQQGQTDDQRRQVGVKDGRPSPVVTGVDGLLGREAGAQLTSAQLPTYFVGAQEHFDTRKAVQEKQGANFKLKAYHDQMLSYGAPPVRFARQLMLDQPIE